MSGTIKSYRDLAVWQKSVDLAESCYLLTRRFPTTERYGLTSQIRRAAVSVAANIAEGHGRSGPGQFVHQLSIARGSLRELETLLLISQRQDYGKTETFLDLAARTDEIGRMLFSLSTKVAASSARGVPKAAELDPETKTSG